MVKAAQRGGHSFRPGGRQPAGAARPTVGRLCMQGPRPSCPGSWRAAVPWTIPRRNLVFVSSISRQADECSSRHLLNVALIFFRPWSCPTTYREAINQPQTSLPCGPRKALEAAPAGSHLPSRAAGGDGGSLLLHLLGDTRGDTVLSADGETEAQRGRTGTQAAM